MGATLAIMKLMDENKLSLDANLGQYVPTVKGSNKENLTLRNLLTHRAGLKAWIPFWKDAVDTVSTLKKALDMYPELEKQCVVIVKKPNFFQRLFGKKTQKTIAYEKSLAQNQTLWNQVLKPETRVWKPNIFSVQKKEPFLIPVANNLFLNNRYLSTIKKQILESPVTEPGKNVYSDLHYYFYPEMVQHLTGTSLENYLYKTYDEMGCFTLKYNPTQSFAKTKIVPTEYDSTFRAQLIHGYVHDEGAAMLGGISGHAGLFGTSNDVMKIMQLYLQKGNYGGRQILRSNILQECTQYQFPLEKNRRGIGFDKKDFDPSITNAPSLFSDLSFGHSGYTGTYAWADPESGFSYVFLSNRVYPTRNNNKISQLNIRSEIGDVIKKSIIKALP
jgi:beta-N-acetylhexosaminidase